MKITLLGSGYWGTALALLLNENGHQVTLWSRDPDKAKAMARTRVNPSVPDCRIPDSITITSELDALAETEMAVFATPSFALRQTAQKAAAYLQKPTILVSGTKGIEFQSFLRMTQILRQECGQQHEYVALSGPSHAEEVARRIPTGCVAASENEAAAKAVQAAFMSDAFRVYTHDDVLGVELVGALKNVAALCCGISDGLGLGDNTRALLITRSLTEISRLCEKMGGRKDTMIGLAGMGDMIVTCGSMHSRNRRAGILIGQGLSTDAAIARIGAVVEGFYAAKSAVALSEKYKVSMPICSGVYQVLYEQKDPKQIAHALMNRQPQRESESCWI